MPHTYSSGFPFFTTYENHLKISLCLQFAMLFIAALILQDAHVLDGPDPFQFFLLSAIAYWSAAAIIMLRRNGKATRLDQFLLKWGYPLMIVLTALVAAIVPIGVFRHH